MNISKYLERIEPSEREPEVFPIELLPYLGGRRDWAALGYPRIPTRQQAQHERRMTNTRSRVRAHKGGPTLSKFSQQSKQTR